MLSKIRGEKSEKTKNSKETKIREKIQNEGGITLIALVVTIIILLILAGVSVQMLLGDQGLIKKAVEAVEKTEIADYEEQLELLGVELAMDEAAGETGGSYTEKYKDKIQENFPGVQVEPNEEDDSLVVETEEGHIYEVTEEGTEYLGEKGDEGLEELPSEDIDAEDIEISIEPAQDWTQSVNVTMEIADENLKKFGIEYLEGDEEKWHEYKAPFTVGETETIKARIVDAIGGKAEAITEKEIKNIDTVEPDEITIKTEPTIDSIAVTATVTDGEQTNDSGQSGIEKISFRKQGEDQWIDESVPGETAPNGQAIITHKFSELAQSQNYTIEVKATDKAGNVKETSTTNTTNTIPELNDGDGSIEVTYTPALPEWANEKVKVTLTSTYTDQYELQYATGYEGNEDDAQWKDYQETGFEVTENGKIGIRLKSGTQYGKVKEYEIKNIDKVRPTVTIGEVTATTNAITVPATVNDKSEEKPDEQSGIEKIEFYYSKDGEIWEEPEKENPTDSEEVIHTFKGLTQDTSYKVKVKVYDKAGNYTETSGENEIKTEKVPDLTDETDITFIFDPNEWTKEDYATVKLELKQEIKEKIGEIGEKYKLQYQTPTEETWQDYSDGFNITENGTVKARLIEKDGEQIGTEATKDYTYFDRKAPTITSLTVSEIKTNSLTATVEATDDQSGLSETEPYTFSIYRGSDTTSEPVKEIPNHTEKTAIFNELEQGTEYTIKVVVKDDVGNTKEQTQNANTTQVPMPEVSLEGNNPEADITIDYDNTNWTPGPVKVTIGKKETLDASFIIQYVAKTGTQTPREQEWKTYGNEPVSVTNNETTVYVRLSDGKNGGEYATATVANIDKNKPDSVSLEQKAETTPTNTKIEVTATAQDADKVDGESGVSGIDKFEFYYKTTDGSDNFVLANDGTKTVNENSENAPQEQVQDFQYTNLTANTKYTLKVKVSDKAGNINEKTTETMTGTGMEIVPEPEPDAETSPFFGAYADIDNDGTADGVIYADVAISQTGSWNPSGDSSSGGFTITKQSGLKTYYVEDENYSDTYGSGKLLAIKDTTGNDRFYVMDFENVGSTAYRWLNTDSTSDDTDIIFGSGKQNTETMLNRYKSTNTSAIWGLSELQNKCKTGTNGHKWFVPSYGEWTAFACNLGINISNYSSKGLSTSYWSSSMHGDYNAFYANFAGGYMKGGVDYGINLTDSRYVRLSMTF